MVLEVVDFIKEEIEKIKNGDQAYGDASPLIARIHDHLSQLRQGKESTLEQHTPAKSEKPVSSMSHELGTSSPCAHTYKAVIRFEEGCEMENIRAYSVIHNLKEKAQEILFYPEDILDNDQCAEVIRRDGFTIILRSNESFEDMHQLLLDTLFLKSLDFEELKGDDAFSFYASANEEDQNDDTHGPAVISSEPERRELSDKGETHLQSSSQQSIVSVNVSKLDKLMDLVGEMVIAEAMVIQNPDLKGLMLDNFQKAAQRLSKITNEIQDMVMSVRMVSLSTTFHKMHRVVRDMCKKLNKDVELRIIGEETEVDKNIIEHISDPLMHLVRNAIDHGIESPEERKLAGKPDSGTVTLEARNSGGDVLVMVRDDGKGLNRDKILQKAMENNLLVKQPSEMTDKEVFNLIFLPGFSTNEKVTEFSGRGVGMDVVTKNIEAIGGSVSVDSTPGKGSMFILKIPLTLAIIDGMTIRVGKASYTLPTIAIKESFRPREEDIITDPDGNEMIMVRGQCYPILRLHRHFKVRDAVTRFSEGIIIMVEQDGFTLCCFADELVGQQQVVVKALPNYIRNFKKAKGLAGCTLLGDGSISLILNIAGLLEV
jgi:two-component system chemotaxis sensor kinase CheA